MKIEKEVYVLVQESDGEIVYLTPSYRLDNDISEAMKAKNRITAACIRDDFFKRYKYELEIVPIKITYEWPEEFIFQRY